MAKRRLFEIKSQNNKASKLMFVYRSALCHRLATTNELGHATSRPAALEACPWTLLGLVMRQKRKKAKEPLASGGPEGVQEVPLSTASTELPVIPKASILFLAE